MPCGHEPLHVHRSVPSTRGSGSASGRGRLFSIPLGCSPSLPAPPPVPFWRAAPLFESLRRYYASIRLLASVGCRACGLWPSPTPPAADCSSGHRRDSSSCAKSFSACSGSMTAWSPQGDWRQAPPSSVAFRTARLRRRSRWLITRLNDWPAASPVNASAAPSRAPPHDSGSGWFAIPSLYRTFIDYSLPVSWRTMLPPLPRHSHWRSHLAHPSSDISLPRKGSRVGPCIVIFEACSAFTRVAACTLAQPPIRGSLYPEASASSSPP